MISQHKKILENEFYTINETENYEKRACLHLYKKVQQTPTNLL